MVVRAHPDVLELRWHVYAKEKRWDACIDLADAVVKSVPDNPQGWIHRSYALHELKRTQEAHDQLLPVADKFADEWIVPYNLACYWSLAKNVKLALGYLARAFDIDSNYRDLAAEARRFEPVLDLIEELIPRVEVVEPGWLFIPIDGAVGYYGGEDALVERVAKEVERLAPGGRFGLASGPFAAYWASRCTAPFQSDDTSVGEDAV